MEPTEGVEWQAAPEWLARRPLPPKSGTAQASG